MVRDCLGGDGREDYMDVCMGRGGGVKGWLGELRLRVTIGWIDGWEIEILSG